MRGSSAAAWAARTLPPHEEHHDDPYCPFDPAGRRVLLATSACSDSADEPEKPARHGGTATRSVCWDKTLAFALPQGFTRATDENNGTNVLIEYLPAGENFDNWTRLVTIQAYRGLGQDPRPTAEIARQAFYPAACKVGPIYIDLGEQAIAPGLKRTLVANGCASLPAGPIRRRSKARASRTS